MTTASSTRPARPLSLALAVAAAASLLSACGSMHMSHPYSQAALPASIQVPAGNRVAMETVGVGEITYECRDKASAAGQTEWVFVGPVAALNDRNGNQVGKYCRSARHLGVDGRLENHRDPTRGRSCGRGQHPLSTRQGEPCHGQWRDDGCYPHPARCDQGRRGAGSHTVHVVEQGPESDRAVPGRLHFLESRVTPIQPPAT